jgi:hypothetical protein
VVQLDSAFGFYSALDSIARYIGITDRECSELSYYEFYTKLAYLSNVNTYNKKLRDIMSKSIK